MNGGEIFVRCINYFVYFLSSRPRWVSIAPHLVSHSDGWIFYKKKFNKKLGKEARRNVNDAYFVCKLNELQLLIQNFGFCRK